MEEADEERLSGYQSGVKDPLKRSCILCVLFSLAFSVFNSWDTPKSPFQSSQSLQKCLPASHAHQLSGMLGTARKAAGDVYNHCKALKSI